MLNKYLLNKQMIPTIQTDICRVAFAVCVVSLWRMMTHYFSRWCPVAWRLVPLSTRQHSLPGEEQRSVWLALALEWFNLFGPQVKISEFKMSSGSCIFFGWWLVFVSTGAHISYGMSLWDLIARYCPTHTGTARGLLKCKFGLCHALGGSLSFPGKIQISHHGSWTGFPGSLCLVLLPWASPFTPKGVSVRTMSDMNALSLRSLPTASCFTFSARWVECENISHHLWGPGSQLWLILIKGLC